MAKHIKTIACIILCALLILAVCFALKQCGIRNDDGQSVHMAEFNKDLPRAPIDDDYRTTYEIFVYSFCDSNDDGIGDLNGVRSKLDYISDLGFDAIWLTPVHPSATYHKYDVDDYYGIDPSFGTMDDCEALIRECHDRGIRVYLDLVLNHTSEDHEWFRAASAYLHELPPDWEPDASYCKYFDYYNFSREPADGYTHLDGTEWYYEAGFWSEMPDLNLKSEDVRDEIRNIMAYWLAKGVDGFRLDAVTSYFANDTGSDIEFLRFLNETAKSIDPDCYLVGEAWTDRSAIASLYTSGIDSFFDFPFAGNKGILADVLNGYRGASDYVKEMMMSEELFNNACPGYVDAPFYTNHDMARSIGYYNDDSGSMARMASAMNLFMSGNAFVYYGEELGMCGAGKDENYRAPMYWSDDPEDPDMCAGPPDMDDIDMRFPSLADQMDDENSMHRWFTEVIRVRNAFPSIARGKTQIVGAVSDDNVAAFFRKDGSGDVLIVMNLSSRTVSKDLSALGDCTLAAVLNTNKERITYEDDSLTLPACSIAVFYYSEDDSVPK